MNRPGAAGSIAIEMLLQSAADGHTLALATMSQAVFNTYLFSKLSYDPLRDLEPVATLVTGAMTIAAHPSFPADNLDDLIRMAKSQPGRLLIAMPQQGSPPHVVGLLLARSAGIELAFVPHKAGPEALNAVIGGQIPLIIDAPTAISAQVTAGKLKALVVTGSQRESALPGVPTAQEAGLTDLEGEAWIGLVAPAGTPSRVVGRLSRELLLVLNAPDMQAQLARFSFRSLSKTPEEFRDLLRIDHEKWSRVIREAGLKLD
jgi:tripartite-type tricarboxylate transporter receptor subunit TctC